MEIDDTGGRILSGEFENFGVAANFDDYAVADGYCLRNGVVGIYSQNVAVNQKQVGGRTLP
jgi:hypothetical protein